jgi:hypothetical protein
MQVEDQIDAAKVIGNYPYVDKGRMGILDGHTVVLWLLIVS